MMGTGLHKIGKKGKELEWEDVWGEAEGKKIRRIAP